MDFCRVTCLPMSIFLTTTFHILCVHNTNIVTYLTGPTQHQPRTNPPALFMNWELYLTRFDLCDKNRGLIKLISLHGVTTLLILLILFCSSAILTPILKPAPNLMMRVARSMYPFNFSYRMEYILVSKIVEVGQGFEPETLKNSF